MKRQKTLSLRLWEALAARVQLSPDDLYKLDRLRRGYEGECLLDQSLSRYGDPDWLVLPNQHLQLGQHMEYDLLLLTPYALINFEVKHYEFDYQYRQGAAYSGNKLLEHDLFLKARLADRALRAYLKTGPRHLARLPVKTVVAFTNPDRRPQIDASAQLDVLYSYQIRDFILNISQQWAYQEISLSALKTWLLSREVTATHHLKIHWQERYPSLRAGIYCPSCLTYYRPNSAHKLHCTHCNYYESKLAACRRLIDELSLLYCHQDLTPKLVISYAERRLSSSLVYRELRRLAPRSNRSAGKLLYPNPYRHPER